MYCCREMYRRVPQRCMCGGAHCAYHCLRCVSTWEEGVSLTCAGSDVFVNVQLPPRLHLCGSPCLPPSKLRHSAATCGRIPLSGRRPCLVCVSSGTTRAGPLGMIQTDACKSRPSLVEECVSGGLLERTPGFHHR